MPRKREQSRKWPNVTVQISNFVWRMWEGIRHEEERKWVKARREERTRIVKGRIVRRERAKFMTAFGEEVS